MLRFSAEQRFFDPGSHCVDCSEASLRPQSARHSGVWQKSLSHARASQRLSNKAGSISQRGALSLLETLWDVS